MTVNPKYQGVRVKKLSPDKVQALLDKEPPFILDVRPLNFEKSIDFIKDSVYIHLVILQDNIDKIPLDREIIIADWAMKQSPLAAKYLKKNGYNIIGILKGGVSRWIQEKRPFEARPSP